MSLNLAEFRAWADEQNAKNKPERSMKKEDAKFKIRILQMDAKGAVHIEDYDSAIAKIQFDGLKGCNYREIDRDDKLKPMTYTQWKVYFPFKGKIDYAPGDYVKRS